MPETIKPSKNTAGGDVVLQEVWHAKEALSAAYGHDLKRLFAEARERQKHSGHPVVNRSSSADPTGR